MTLAMKDVSKDMSQKEEGEEPKKSRCTVAGIESHHFCTMLLARVRSTATLRAIAQRQLHSTPQWRAEDVLERLRKNFEDKKQEHVEAAKRDGASILSVTGQASDLEQSLTHKCGLVNYNEAHKTKAIYGFGYTRPDEVYVPKTCGSDKGNLTLLTDL